MLEEVLAVCMAACHLYSRGDITVIFIAFSLSFPFHSCEKLEMAVYSILNLSFCSVGKISSFIKFQALRVLVFWILIALYSTRLKMPNATDYSYFYMFLGFLFTASSYFKFYATLVEYICYFLSKDNSS